MPSALDTPADATIHVWRVGLDGGGRTAARAALGDLLAAYLGTAGPPPLAVDPGGKPRLAEAPARLAFSLSHSEDLALVATAPGEVEVGVDVERMKPRRDLVRLAARWLPEADAETIASAGAEVREELFYAAWTRHEARVKCTGAGLGGPPPGPEVVAWALEIDPGYAAAVALSGAPEAGAPRVLFRDASCRG